MKLSSAGSSTCFGVRIKHDVLFEQLESSHETPINIILDDEGQSAAENQSIFTKNTGAVTQIQSQKKAAAGIKGAKAFSV